MRNDPEHIANEHDDLLSDEHLHFLAGLMINFEATIEQLPEQEKAEYRKAQQSVVDARRAGEREAYNIYII